MHISLYRHEVIEREYTLYGHLRPTALAVNSGAPPSCCTNLFFIIPPLKSDCGMTAKTDADRRWFPLLPQRMKVQTEFLLPSGKHGRDVQIRL